MKKENFKEFRKKLGGMPANAVVMPVVVIIAILHALIIAAIASININSKTLSTTMQNYSEYISDASSLQAGSSLSSETSSIYVLRPILSDGTPNVGTLIAYANEQTLERRGYQVKERFKNYDVSLTAYGFISAAAASADRMNDAQAHALALMNQIYTLPPVEALSNIPKYELTPDELSLSAEEKRAKAFDLVFGEEYTADKESVSKNVVAATSMLREESAKKSATASQNIAYMRTLLWIATFAIIATLLYTFIVMFRLLINPLSKFVGKIADDDRLQENKGLYEIRLLASSYNSLLKRRNKLEGVLRTTAETDALTGLPNRYSMNNYIFSSDDSGYSVAVFLFDLNYLKATNDKLGHAAGDKLICEAAKCISESFGVENENNCFRFGGDEFAAIVKNSTEESINEMIKTFTEKQKEHNVSIAIGKAYTEEIGTTSFPLLLEQADKDMYINKNKMHKNDDINQ